MSIESPGNQEERSQAAPGATAAVVAPDTADSGAAKRWSPRDLLRADLGQVPVFIGLVVIAIYFQIASGGFFLNAENLSGLAEQVTSVPILGIAAASTLVLLIGEIDLSVATVAYFCGAVTGVLSVRQHVPAAEAILAGILVGVIIGLINGVLVAALRMPSFIVTLGGLIFYQGALEHLLQPQTTLQIIDPVIDGIYTYELPYYLSIVVAAIALAIYAAFVLFGRAQRQRAGLPVQSPTQLAVQLGLPVVIVAAVVYELNAYLGVSLPVIITLALVIILWLLSTKTAFGRHIYAVGGNAEASRRAGIRVVGLRIAIFTLASTVSAIAGILIISRGASAPALVNGNLLLFAIAAAVIGGVSLFGGRGSIWGIVLGSLIMGALTNGLSLLNVGPDVVEMVAGSVLVLAVLIDAIARRRSVTGYR
jgi:D-xylose transport system permease protein